MARRIWQSDFAHLWFGLCGGMARPVDVRKGRHGQDPCSMTPEPGPARPLGIVERNRLARRHKWALKQPE